MRLLVASFLALISLSVWSKSNTTLQCSDVNSSLTVLIHIEHSDSQVHQLEIKNQYAHPMLFLGQKVSFDSYGKIQGIKLSNLMDGLELEKTDGTFSGHYWYDLMITQLTCREF